MAPAMDSTFEDGSLLYFLQPHIYKEMEEAIAQPTAPSLQLIKIP